MKFNIIQNKKLRVDADSLVFYAASNKDNLEEAIDSIIERINTIKFELSSEDLIFFLTLGRESYRYTIYPAYKENRKNKVLPVLVKPLKLWLIDNYKCIFSQHLEADDLVAIHYNLDSKNSIICSPDCDFTTIPCTLYDYKNSTINFISEEEAEFNYWKYVLQGKTKDNIKGLKKVGETTAYKIMQLAKNSKQNYKTFITKVWTEGINPNQDNYAEFGFKKKTTIFPGTIEELELAMELNKLITTEEELRVKGINYFIEQ